MNTNELKTVSKLYLALAIVTTVLIVPILGALVNQFGLLALASVVLAIVVIVKAGKVGVKKNGAILIVAGAIINLVSVVVLYGFVGTAGSMGENAVTSYQTGEAVGTALGGLMISSVIGIIAWVVLLVGVIFSYMAYANAKNQAVSNNIDTVQ